GMEHRDGAGGALELAVVLAERLQRLPTALHQCIVDEALVVPGQGSELGGQGKRDQEVLPRYLALELTRQPLLALVVLTVRAGAVAAGVRHEGLPLAALALDPHARAGRGAAVLHGGKRPALAGEKALGVLVEELGLEGLDDRRKGRHCTARHVTEKPSIRALMRSTALLSVRVVRWA